VEIRSLLRRVLGQSSDSPETQSPAARGDVGEPESIEETLDEIREDQAPETGRGLP